MGPAGSARIACAVRTHRKYVMRCDALWFRRARDFFIHDDRAFPSIIDPRIRRRTTKTNHLLARVTLLFESNLLSPRDRQTFAHIWQISPGVGNRLLANGVRPSITTWETIHTEQAATESRHTAALPRPLVVIDCSEVRK